MIYRIYFTLRLSYISSLFVTYVLHDDNEIFKVRFVICALVSVLGTLLVTLIVLGHQDSKYNAEKDDLYTSFKQDGVLYDILLKTG